MYCAHAGTILRQLALATSHLIIGSRPMSVGGTVSGDGPSGQQAAIIALDIRNCCLVGPGDVARSILFNELQKGAGPKVPLTPKG